MTNLLKQLRRTSPHVNWLIPVSPTEWNLVRNHLSYGIPRGHRAMQRIVVEDVLLFYIPKRAGGELAGSIVGVFQVASDWSTNVEGMDEENQALYPLRIRLKSIKFGQVDFWALSKSLSFVIHKENPSFYLRGTPANLNRPIPERDLKLILRKMK